ncbi:MAG TPA: CDGSH iron-sulfur domain-containing protein [Motilibacteraceae bacterium]|nr:CDGSH iron-sulfur domain-containing protein [Motilibacteraceae bacterium]
MTSSDDAPQPPEQPAQIVVGSGATITPYEDGPLVVRGDVRITAPDGTVVDPGRETFALCRCGRSRRKPFCDGSHLAARFRAPAGDGRPEELRGRLAARRDIESDEA